MRCVLDHELVPVEHQRDGHEVPDGVGVEQAVQRGEVVYLSAGSTKRARWTGGGGEGGVRKGVGG